MRIESRKLHFNYEVLEKIEAGVVLNGAEVKSLLAGKASLDEAYVKIIDGEAFLLNAHISIYEYADKREIDTRRTKKLLLHKKEILALENKLKQKNLALVPVAWYNKGGQIKLEIALARGKKKWEKKEVLKKADLAREVLEDLKLKIRR